MILNICKKRNNEWSRHVQVRVQSAVSDFHVANALYYDDCRNKFMRSRSDKSKKTATDPVQQDAAFDTVTHCKSI